MLRTLFVINLKVCSCLASAVRVKVVEICNYITVVVGITYTYSAVAVNSYVVVSVTHVEFLKSSVGFDRPVNLSVLFRYRKDLRYMRNEVIIVKAVFYNLS